MSFFTGLRDAADLLNPSNLSSRIFNDPKKRSRILGDIADSRDGGLIGLGGAMLGGVTDAIGDKVQSVDDNVIDPIGEFVGGKYLRGSEPARQAPRNSGPIGPVTPEGHFERRRQRARQQRIQDLQSVIEDTPTLNREILTRRARRQVMPLFRPQIREAKRSIRMTEREGRQAADQVSSYYDQASGKVRGFAKADRKASRKAMRNMRGNTEQVSSRAKVNMKSAKGMNKANQAFFKQMQGALAGEGAVAAADTRKNYKTLANEYRSDLADLRTQRAQAMQAAKRQIRSDVRNTANALYQNAYLGAIENGLNKKKAQKLALAQAEGGIVKNMLAKTIRNNMGAERALIKQSRKSELSPEQRWQRKKDTAAANDRQIKTWERQVKAAKSENRNEDAAYFQALINQALGYKPGK